MGSENQTWLVDGLKGASPEQYREYFLKLAREYFISDSEETLSFLKSELLSSTEAQLRARLTADGLLGEGVNAVLSGKFDLMAGDAMSDVEKTDFDQEAREDAARMDANYRFGIASNEAGGSLEPKKLDDGSRQFVFKDPYSGEDSTVTFDAMGVIVPDQAVIDRMTPLEVGLNQAGLHAARAVKEMSVFLEQDLQVAKELLDFVKKFNPRELESFLSATDIGNAKKRQLLWIALYAANLTWQADQVPRAVLLAKTKDTQTDQSDVLKQRITKNTSLSSFDDMLKTKGWSEVAKDLDQIQQALAILESREEKSES